MASPETPIAYILGTFPQASQTFIAREIRGLRRLGVPLTIFALARRSADVLEAADRLWYRDVRFVPRALAPSVLAANFWWLVRDPGRYLRTLAAVTELPHQPRVLALRAVVLVMIAAWIARELERTGGCRQIHAHFALAQTEVAMAVSRFLDRPYSFTAHARDIYATPSALEEKMHGAARVVTCTAYNVEHLRTLCPDLPPDHVQLVHHGIDLAPPRGQTPPTQNPASIGSVPKLLAAGRLVEKKGFETLVSACALLRDRGVAFHCGIAGDGPLHATLARRIADAGLSQDVELTGWIDAGRLSQMMSESALFVMPSQVTESGDRDGIPNVILEAMGAAVPVVGTRVSGIPEAVEDGVTGTLVPPGDAPALAAAIERLLGDAALRSAMSTAAYARAMTEFDLAVSSRQLANAFGIDVAPAEAGAQD